MNTNSLKAKDLVAYALIAVGVVALLGRLSGGAGWLWIGLIAAVFLWAWVMQKSYGLLVTGCILSGVAVGILLEGSWGWDGAFLISLGIGFIMIDRLETRQNKWPFYVGVILAVLGLLVGILQTGFLGSFWFALLLIGAGVFLLARSQGPGGSSDAGWVKVEPQPPSPGFSSSGSSSSQYAASATPPATPSTSNDSSVSSTLSTSEVVSSFTGDVSASGSAQASVSTTPMPSAPIVTPATTTVPDTTLPFEYDQDLYTRLEFWRRETARAEDRAAYLILTNDTMQQIATLKPQTMQELLDIKGIGEVKLERYGEALLKLIKGE